MNILIHDINNQEFERVFHNISENNYIISDMGFIKNCIGCFGCWIKTPGKCVIKDGYENLGEIFSRADNIIVVSECFYGGYSPFVKNILDRSISYLLPFFKIWNNETHHQKRYKNNFKFISYFYGENITLAEMSTAKKLVSANSINFSAADYSVSFFESIIQLSEEVNIL